jgi:hypothetical protein
MATPVQELPQGRHCPRERPRRRELYMNVPTTPCLLRIFVRFLFPGKDVI